ncbi:Vegetative incompatibility HET-E-1 [Fusarium agapanthi]|uniref:Vegetative incompatibility HET-E-1 n=1 Tax=Fusarium agapanthi TaxID=1803897 RepID=A0A9P5BFE0_9HYPO|nr:Vegetative incompatibility HET-E-1 [Fusarium agapanthi]
MNDTTGITTAAAGLVGITDEAIRFFQKLDRNTNSVSKRAQQLESFSTLARDVELKPATNDHDDEDQLGLTKHILVYCYKLIGRILSQLEWVDNGGRHTSTQQGLFGVYAELNNREAKNLFEDLHREQLCLAAFRNSRFKPLSWASESDSHPLEYCHAFKDHELDFLNLLFVTDPREDRASLQSRKGPITKGTCTWITKDFKYKSWLSGSGGRRGLHIQGGEGHGKTILATYLTEQLEQLAACILNGTVLYFFCDHGNINANSATAVLRGLIWQLCRLHPALLHHGLKRAVSIDEGRITLATKSVETLWQIFTAMVQDPNVGTVTCVVDGLGECDESSIKTLAEMFSELLSSENQGRRNFRILLTSRHPYQQDNFSTEFSVICLDADAHKHNVQDARRLINHHVSNIAHEHGWSQDFQDQMNKSLTKRAGGSFLWASLAVSGLKGQDEDTAAKYLDDLAGDINTIYERCLLAIPLECRQKVRSILTWVTLAYYPPSLGELSTLTSDEFSTPDTVLINLKACLGSCGALLMTKTEIRRFGFGYETIETIETIQLQPYVLRTATDTDDDFDFFRIIPDNGHEILASRCLKIIEEGIRIEAERESSVEQANIGSLFSHSRPRSRSEDRVIKVQRGGILQLSIAEIVAVTPIELTVLGGLHKVASLLLDRYPRRPIWPNFSFALATAVSHCDEDMVRLLIEAGAPRISVSRQLEGPICTAVVNRRLDVVKFLCCSEAKIWTQPISKLDEVTQALMCLSSAADSSLLDGEVFIQYAKVLLRGGASPDGYDVYGGNHGFRYWKRAVMEYLHRHGITLQNLGPYPNRENPLMVFVSSIGANSPLSDPVDAVQFLLDSGASINQTDLEGWTALHHVANQIALGRAKKSYEARDDAEEYQLYKIANLLITAGIDQELEDREKRRAANILGVVGAPIWNRNISEYE